MRRGVALTLCAVLCSLLMLGGCGGTREYSETFRGYLSPILADTPEDAAAVFVREELCGGGVERTFCGYTFEEMVDGPSREGMDLPADAVNISRGHVSYEGESGNKGQAKVYIVEREDGYSYFAPPIPSGRARHGELLSLRPCA